MFVLWIGALGFRLGNLWVWVSKVARVSFLSLAWGCLGVVNGWVLDSFFGVGFHRVIFVV